jgi:HEAT repeat protein
MTIPLADRLANADPSARLQVALNAGMHPDPESVGTLVERCAVEPDFFVRDMLTWALTRQPREVSVPLLLDELASAEPQARSQALHTLSKIGDARAWPAVSGALLHDSDDDVARSAWRAAVALVPDGAAAALAAELARELGRGDVELQRSLSRALVVLGDAAGPALADATATRSPAVLAHVIATRRLLEDPEAGFAPDVEEAKRVAILRGAPMPDTVD